CARIRQQDWRARLRRRASGLAGRGRSRPCLRHWNEPVESTRPRDVPDRTTGAPDRRDAIRALFFNIAHVGATSVATTRAVPPSRLTSLLREATWTPWVDGVPATAGG